MRTLRGSEHRVRASGVESGRRYPVQCERVSGLVAVVLGMQEAATHRDWSHEPGSGAAVRVDETDPDLFALGDALPQHRERVGVRPHEGNTPPRVTIEAPRHLDVPGRFAGTFEAGGVTFRGAVDDAEDGAEPLQLRWDAEPILPAGPALAPVEGSTLATFPLASIGGNRTIYRVTFRATDRGGLEGKQVIDVVVIP